MLALLYVSRSTMAPETAAAAVADIIAVSRDRNPARGLTGALLFTGQHFAQVLEGPVAAVDQLMATVAADPRHDDLVVVDRRPIAQRRFGRWSMAYYGPSQFVTRHVTRLLDDRVWPSRARSAGWLNDLMWEFAEGPGADYRELPVSSAA